MDKKQKYEEEWRKYNNDETFAQTWGYMQDCKTPQELAKFVNEQHENYYNQIMGMLAQSSGGMLLNPDNPKVKVYLEAISGFYKALSGFATYCGLFKPEEVKKALDEYQD